MNKSIRCSLKKTRFRRIISFLLVIVLLSSAISINCFEVNASDKIAVGDTITLGVYDNNPIEWVCILIDENGPLMLSKEVLCQKEFDAPGADAYYHSDGWGWVRNNAGSNCWYDSNIRQWLNTKGAVDWTHCPPSYSDSVGFLSCFTNEELELVHTVSQAVYVNSWETTRDGYVDGGSRASIDVWNIPDLKKADYSTYWYQNVTDSFFLLGELQIALGYDNLPDVVTSSTYTTRISNNTGASYECVRIVQEDGSLSTIGASTIGNIRPAFYINKQGVKEELNYGFDHFSYGEDFSIESGLTEETVIKYISEEQDIDDLTITSSDESIVKIEGVVPGQGSKTEIFPEECEHVGTVKLKGLALGSAEITVTAPSGVKVCVTVTVTERSKTYGEDTDIHNDITYKDGIRVPVKFSRDWFRPASDKYVRNTNYDQGLATFCSDFALMGYNTNEGIIKCLEDCGFEPLSEKSVEMDTKQREVNTFIAAKTITIDASTKKHLVFVGTIGSNKKQWYSNFDPLDGEDGNINTTTKTNLGFVDAMNYAYDHLKEELTPEKGFTQDNTILLLTGHSRGAATANLLTKKIIDEGKWAKPENIYTYAFATPNVTAENDVDDDKYKCIFNIVNPEDFVTKVMLKKWGYSKYGTTYVLPSKTNTVLWEYSKLRNRMQKTYSVLTNGKTYKPYTLGESTTQTIINLMGANIPTVRDLYAKKYHAYGLIWLSPFEFFKDCMLPLLPDVEDDLLKKGDSLIKCLNIISNPLIQWDLFYKLLLLYFLDPDADIGVAVFSKSQILAQLTVRTTEILDFLVAHHAETYCAYMHALTKDEVTKDKGSFIGAVNCPVDVEIIDKNTNEIVGKIKDNVVDEEILAKENSVVMTVNGDEKKFWLPAGGDYEVCLTGNDDGVMDYTLIKNDSEEGELERANFFDVPVVKGKEVIAEVLGESYKVAQHELISEDGTVIKPSETMGANNAVTYDVKLKVSGAGAVSGDTTYTSGDYAEISASQEPGNGFVGWYDGEKLVSREENYRFRVSGNVTYTARFEKMNCQHENTVIINKADATDTEDGYTGDIICADCLTVVEMGSTIPKLGKTIIPGDVNGDGEILANDARLALRASAKLETLDETQTKAADVNEDGKVLADDARQILRFSAQLQKSFITV